MNAIYKNRLYRVVEVTSDLLLADGSETLAVSLSDESLVIDPTDREAADVENFVEWFGLDGGEAKAFKAILRGAANPKDRSA